MSSKLSLKLIAGLVVLFSFGVTEASGSNPSAESLSSFTARYHDLTLRLEEAVAADPDNLDLRIKLSGFYCDFRDYEKAIAILKNIDSREAKVVLAKAYAKLKEHDYAIEIFEQLKPLPEDPEYLYLYGTVLEEKNLFPKAIKIYARVGPPFELKAKERVKSIRFKVEKEIPEAIAKISRKAKSFLKSIKDDAAVYLLVDEDMEVRTDNTSLSTVHIIEKVLKERGKELAEVEIGYDSTYQRIELEFRTITKDGKVIYAGKENIRDIGRYLNYPLYSNSRAFIVSMPSVDVGSFIEYKIKIYSSKLINEDDFTFIYRLREKYPIFRAAFRLIVPKKRKVNFKFFNPDYAKGIKLKPSAKIKGDKRIYSWSFKKIDPIVPEYAMPPVSFVNPAVLVSSFSTWEEIYKWWHSLYRDKIEATAEIKSFTQKLIAGKSSERDKAKAIHEFVAKNIRYVAIEYGDSGYEPHRAEEVFINRYGDCKDQAILLVSMLRAAGLKAYPVLIPTRKAYPIAEDFPSSNFNHAICAVELGKELIFMDPTAEATPFAQIPLSDQKRKVLVFFDETYKILTVPQIKENTVRYVMDIDINRDENATVTRKVYTQGFFASSYRWYLKYTHPAIIEEDIRKKMVALSSLSRLLDYVIKDVDDFDSPPSLVYKFKADKFLNPAGELRIIPALDEVSLNHEIISKEKRDFPVDFEGFYTKQAVIKINLPGNLKVKYLPDDLGLENPWFKLSASNQKLPGAIDFRQELTVKKKLVAQKNYPEFKRYFEDALYRLKEQIILKRNKPR